MTLQNEAVGMHIRCSSRPMSGSIKVVTGVRDLELQTTRCYRCCCNSDCLGLQPNVVSIGNNLKKTTTTMERRAIWLLYRTTNWRQQQVHISDINAWCSNQFVSCFQSKLLEEFVSDAILSAVGRDTYALKSYHLVTLTGEIKIYSRRGR